MATQEDSPVERFFQLELQTRSGWETETVGRWPDGDHREWTESSQPFRKALRTAFPKFGAMRIRATTETRYREWVVDHECDMSVEGWL